MSRVPTLIDGTGEIALFDPKTTKDKDARANAVIEYAKRMKNWPLLELAVEAKIKEQAQFVEWWDKNVRRPGQPAKN